MTPVSHNSTPISHHNATTKLVSLNARGLNVPEKRTQVLLSMHKLKADIIYVQETHFKTDSIPKFSDLRYPTAFHATNKQSKTKGVSILISKQCPLIIKDTLADEDGRFLFVKGSLFGKPLTLANIYAPNIKQVPFFRHTLQLLASFQEGILLTGGDFNVPLTPIQDTSSGASKLPFSALRAIKQCFQELTLHDAWRTLNPSTKDYTFFSNPHGSYSRLDYFFISQNDLPMLKHTSIEPMYISDHHPITMSLEFPSKHTRSQIWRLDPSLLTDISIVSTIHENLKLYFQDNDSLEISPMIKWEAHKCTIRGKLIAIASKRRRERQAHISILSKRIQNLEKIHKKTRALSTLEELTQVRTELKEVLHKQIKRKYILSQKIFYEHGNKSSKILARALRAKRSSTTLHSINDPSGSKVTSNTLIADQFVNYFSQLYNINPHKPTINNDRRTHLIKEFLAQHGPKPISYAEALHLERPISKDELESVLKQLKTGKSPGPDGLMARYYKEFIATLYPHFLNAFNSLSSENPPPRDLLTAHIVVIPKPDKDPNLVHNYRPISLLNVDLKIYAKILANRLLPLLPGLISLDQVGFVPGREARDNTLKAISIHNWLTSKKQPGFLLSLDAEKAFDRVAWDYLKEVLTHIGIRDRMLQFILALYSTPTAKVRINGHLSNAFSISNGTRQGCPLSPLIFVLALEPCLTHLKNNPNIKGITIAKSTYKLAAFADDILLFLTEPHITLPNLLKDLTFFENLTYLKINFAKSEALNITLPPDIVKQCQTNFPFKWKPSAIKYLGVYIPTSLSDLYSKNYTPIIQNIQKDLNTWSTGLFSWFGRVSIIKMTIMPKFLYLLQTIPVSLPQTFFNAYRKSCMIFIWNDK